jgi:hypothetical protein
MSFFNVFQQQQDYIHDILYLHPFGTPATSNNTVTQPYLPQCYYSAKYANPLPLYMMALQKP